MKRLMVCIMAVLGRLLVCFFLISVAMPPMAIAVDRLHFFSEEYPPFNYHDGDRAVGIAVDVLELMLEHSGSEQNRSDIRFEVWARAYFSAINRDNGVVFSTMRTKVRDPLFKWVGPIAEDPVVVLGKKSAQFAVADANALHAYKIVVVNDDIGEVFLNKIGMPANNITIVPHPEMAAKLLDSDRVQLWVHSLVSARLLYRRLYMDPDQYAIVFRESGGDGLYYAFNKNISDSLVARMQAALDLIKSEPADGSDSEFRKIFRRYDMEHLLE